MQTYDSGHVTQPFKKLLPGGGRSGGGLGGSSWDNLMMPFDGVGLAALRKAGM